MSKEFDGSKKHGGGPKTLEGKRRSSLNATRHGFTAETILLPSEDPEAFQELLDDYVHDFAPQTRFELDLVHELVATRWRLQRIWGMESTIFQIGMKRSAEAVRAEFDGELPHNVHTALAFIEMSGDSRALQLLNRYETRLSRRFHQIQCELKAFANARKAEQNEEPSPVQPVAPQKVRNELAGNRTRSGPAPRPIRPVDGKTPPAPFKAPPDKEDAA
jgi:hypothetical protein